MPEVIFHCIFQAKIAITKAKAKTQTKMDFITSIIDKTSYGLFLVGNFLDQDFWFIKNYFNLAFIELFLYFFLIFFTGLLGGWIVIKIIKNIWIVVSLINWKIIYKSQQIFLLRTRRKIKYFFSQQDKRWERRKIHFYHQFNRRVKFPVSAYPKLASFVFIIFSLLSYNLPERYQLNSLLSLSPRKESAVMGEANYRGDDLLGGNKSLVADQEKLALYSFANQNENKNGTFIYQGIPPGRLGDILVNERGEMFVAKNSINSKEIGWHAIETEDIDSNSITSRTIRDGSINSEDLAKKITINRMKVKHEFNIGDNLSVGDGLPSYFSLGSGDVYVKNNLEVGGVIYGTISGAYSPSGDLDMNSNVITNIGSSGTDFTATGGLNLAGELNVNNYLFVDTTTGNVGVGTTSPSGLLDVNGDIYLKSTGRIGFDTSSRLFFNSLSSGTAAMYIDSNRNIGMGYALPGTAKLAINGNVGIGTTSPKATLEVVTGVSTIVPHTFADNFVVRQENSAAGISVISSNSQLASIYFGDTDNNAAGRLAYDHSNNSLWLGVNTHSSDVLINSSGNVGIGTTDPVYQLTVSGIDTGIGILRYKNNSSGPYIEGKKYRGTEETPLIVSGGDKVFRMIGQAYDGGATRIAANIDFEVDGTPGSSDMPGRIIFNTTTDGTITTSEKMRITNGGNVGIGTTSPGNKLTVLSSTQADGIYVRESDDGNDAITLTGYNGGGVFAVKNAGAIVFRVDGSSPTGNSYFNGGNVGIGTTVPLSELHIDDSSIGSSVRITLQARTAASVSRTAYINYAADNRIFTINTNNGSDSDFSIVAGNVGIGITAPNEKLEVNGRIRMSTWTADGDTVVYKDDPTGNFGVQASDIRLKKNIQEIDSALKIIGGIRGVTFNWEDDSSEQKPIVGVVAQDVYSVMPELTFNITDPDGHKYLGVHYDKLAPVLIEAVKEQQNEIDNYQLSITNQLENTNDSILELINNSDSLATNFKNLRSDLSTMSEDNTDIVAQLKNVDNQVTQLSQNTKQQNDQISQLEDQMKTLQEQNQAVIDFALALNTKSLIYKDSLGNVNLTDGKITAKDIEALDTITAKNIIATGKVAGASIEIGADASGKGTLKAGETSVVIKTIQASSDAKIYITPLGKLNGRSLYIDPEEIKDGESFEVLLDGETLDKNIEFNWLIVR